MSDITDDSLLGGRVGLWQPAKGHRAGTDAVVLAAAAPVRAGDVVMDVGASTGAVGLMVAAREPGAHLTFIERDPALAELCRRNCDRNHVQGRVAVLDLLHRSAWPDAGLEREGADLVLSNPPFLEEGSARISPDSARAAAHALPEGGLDAWMKACVALLKPKGRLVIIHRADRIADCLAALGRGVGAVTLRFVHPSASQPAIRVLLAATKGSRSPLSVAPPLILNGPDGHFTLETEAIHRGDAVLT